MQSAELKETLKTARAFKPLTGLPLLVTTLTASSTTPKKKATLRNSLRALLTRLHPEVPTLPS